jgi:hypothetical protein
MRDGNATQAAIRAGYSWKTARQIGAENLAKPVIREEINRRIEDYTRTAGIDRVKLLQQLYAMTQADTRKFFTPGGNIRPPAEWPDEVAALVTGYRAGTAKTAAKITFESRANLMFKLLDEITLLEQNVPKTGGRAIPTFDVGAVIERIKQAQAVCKGRVIDVTPK